ncbi:PTS sugar transporter subunit IIA [Streptococcus sp. H49]|uniref:PTS sugar transporter subunit IIA n=1 Tax=Streptococcus huangxiaojuni TaxID=3237239 RepID=UPI0034A39DF0
MDSNLYQLYLDSDLDSRKAVYDFLAEQAAKKTALPNSAIAEAFIQREAVGNIEIAPGVVLPHFESADISSSIIIIRPKSSIIFWSETISRVDLIIGLTVSSYGDKTSLRDFIKKLADSDFIACLKQNDRLKIKELMET